VAGLCDAAEELNDEEKRAELLPIIAQQLYVATRLGKLTDAANFAKSLDVSRYVQLSRA
jgi:signal recognition particle subunit SRP72